MVKPSLNVFIYLFVFRGKQMYFKLVCKKCAYCHFRDYCLAVKESVVPRQL